LTVLHLAVPSLSAQLQPSSAQLLWITDLDGSWSRGSWPPWDAGDQIGRRRLLLAGGTAFGVVSLPGRCRGCRGDPGPLDAGPVDAGAAG
jgi:MFS transporter, DHA2 family, multidrug resistance protein